MINEQIKKEVVFKKEQAKPSVKVNPPKKKTKPHHRRNVKSLAIPNQIEEIVKNFKNHNIQDQNMFKPHAVSRNNSPKHARGISRENSDKDASQESLGRLTPMPLP